MNFELTKDEKRLLNITRDLFDYFGTDYIPIKEVLKFLGRYYLIEGVVVEGKHRGHKIGIPTANVKSEQEVYPLY